MTNLNLFNSECVEWLKSYEGPLFDSAVTDPPYELGFMGKTWDNSGVAFRPETWRAVYDALKPGAHLVAFSSCRTYHRMACAIEDAGFEIREQLAWVFGQGFPKSHDVSKAIDKAAGAEREVVAVERNFGASKLKDGKNAFGDYAGEWNVTAPATPGAQKWQGWGSALKPAWEPICLARKPLSEKNIATNVLAHGTGAINVDGCRVGTDESLNGGGYNTKGTSRKNVADASSYATKVMDKEFVQPAGRFPANLLHDGSPEVLAGFPADCGANGGHGQFVQHSWAGQAETAQDIARDKGSAARFFYSAKAGPLDRIGTAHATVKPVDLMRWLCRLITPPGGHILEPFAGSGTTGIAAMAEGFDCTMIELEADHVTDIKRKLAYLRGEGGASIIEKHKARIDRAKGKPGDAGPLFGDAA